MTIEGAVDMASGFALDTDARFQQAGFSQESWQMAKQAVAGIQPTIPPVFGAVRVLTSHVLEDHIKSNCLTSMLKLPSFETAVYRFCSSVFPESKFEPHSITPVRLKELLGFDVCAVILGLLFGYRRAKKAVPDIFFVDLATPLHVRAEIGYHLGHQLPELGSAAGMLLGGVRDLALGFICAIHPKEFGLYKRHLERRQINFDVQYEIDEWGFSHPQVMALLTQTLGFGYLPAVAFFMGLSPLGIDPVKDLWASRFRTVSLWMDALESGIPLTNRISMRGFTISQSDLAKLAQTVMSHVEAQSVVLWLDDK